MSGFEKFAVVGAGNIGSVIVDELLKSSAVYSVVVLTRSVHGSLSLKEHHTNRNLAERYCGPAPTLVLPACHIRRNRL